MKLPSKFQIGDKVTIENTETGGTVVAIRFTLEKVFYDVFSDYYGKVFKDVAVK